MLAFFGVIFILAGLVTLGAANTMFGQIAGLVLWVIAALFMVGHAVIAAIEREARGLGKALAMHVRATTNAPSAAEGGQPTRSAPPIPPELVERKSLGERLADLWGRL